MPDSAPPFTSFEHPTRLGPYRILQVLGEGGMGIVYEAEQLEPVNRLVALKVIKAGMDTRGVVARFEAERQALAVMSHPGIAKVLDAGATETGLPYFVMELVPGVSLTEYCDARQLSVAERLRLFVEVCQAVQHAHQKGVIHRDLKPSNVLVMEVDGRPVPKIIDFGIAKATGQRLTEKTLVTMLGEALGTPAYMSPEQAERSGLDVDTRTDIYSLGVILYELLVGQLPSDPEELGMLGFIAQLISRETESPVPSMKYATLVNRKDRVASLRHTNPLDLRRTLAGDLDWIVMKAMDKERARRYETANALATDIERYLTDEPIAARPPSLTYRFRKFARRHRAWVVAGSAGLLAIVGGGAAATLGFVRATRAEDAARQEAASAKQVSDFLVDLFRVSQPSVARANVVTARELLDSGAVRVARQLAGQPVVAARMLSTMGSAYSALGLYDQARALLDSGLHLRERTLGANDPTVVQSLLALGSLAQRRGDLPEAERQVSRVFAIDSATGRMASASFRDALYLLASIRTGQRRGVQAESLFTRIMALDSVLPNPDSSLASAHLGLGLAYYMDKRYAAAEPELRRALAYKERALGPGNVQVAYLYLNLGSLYQVQSRFAEALAMYERARPVLEATLGPEHPNVAAVLNNIGQVDKQLHRTGEAETLLRRALVIEQKVLAPDSPNTASTEISLAGLLQDEGHLAESETLYRAGLAVQERMWGPTNETVVVNERSYAQLLRRMGRTTEAASLEARAKLAGKAPK